MKSILSILLILLGNTVFAQQVDSLAWRYSSIRYTISGFTSKSNVDVDYGDSATGWEYAPELLKDGNEKAIKFKSPVDALNWMSIRGWELVQSYMSEDDLGIGGKIKYQNFIMRRKEPLPKH